MMEPSVTRLKTGTFGGTLLVVITQINTEELLKTALLAAIGATVSLGVTMGWKWLLRRVRRKGDW